MVRNTLIFGVSFKARWRNNAQIWYGQFRSRISIIAKATRIYRKSLFFLIWRVICNISLNSLPPRHWTLYDQSFFRFVIYAWGVVKLVISENTICHKCCIIGQSFMLGFLLAKYSSHCLSYSHQSKPIYLSSFLFFILYDVFSAKTFQRLILRLILLQQLFALHN